MNLSEQEMKELVDKLVKCIQQDREHTESLFDISRERKIGYNRAILMIEDFASEIITETLKAVKGKGGQVRLIAADPFAIYECGCCRLEIYQHGKKEGEITYRFCPHCGTRIKYPTPPKEED